MPNPHLLLAIIPARSGSKRLPGKNIMPLAGKPLIVHSIECARNCPIVSRVIVSTDSPEIREISLKAGAEAPFLRPAELAGDFTPSLDVVLHTIDFIKQNEIIAYEYIVILEPTSPLRIEKDIETAFQILRSSHADSIVGITQTPVNIRDLVMIENGEIKPLTPDLLGVSQLFKLNGAIYISRTESIMKTGHLLGEKIIPYIMSDLRSVEIDTLDEFQLAEILMDWKLKRRNSIV